MLKPKRPNYKESQYEIDHHPYLLGVSFFPLGSYSPNWT